MLLFSCGACAGLTRGPFSCGASVGVLVFMWRLFWPQFAHVKPLPETVFSCGASVNVPFSCACSGLSLSMWHLHAKQCFHVVPQLTCLFSCGACSGLSGAPFSCGASAGVLVFMWRLFWPQVFISRRYETHCFHVALLLTFRFHVAPVLASVCSCSCFSCGACSGLSGGQFSCGVSAGVLVFMWRFFWPQVFMSSRYETQCFHVALLPTFRFHVALVLASVCSCGASAKTVFS